MFFACVEDGGEDAFGFAGGCDLEFEAKFSCVAGVGDDAVDACDFGGAAAEEFDACEVGVGDFLQGFLAAWSLDGEDDVVS